MRLAKHEIQPQANAAFLPVVDLSGKIGLVMGIADEFSIATGCAEIFAATGATLVATYKDFDAKKQVQAIAQKINCPLVMACDLRAPGELETVVKEIKATWGKLDFVLHSVVYAPREELNSPLLDTTPGGFASAMDISCHSFIRLSQMAAPLMKEGGSLVTMTFHKSDCVVDNYGIMGPIKAALESSVRYLAADLGSKDIRVNAISSGPIRTKSSRRIRGYDQYTQDALLLSAEGRLATSRDVGALAAFLVSDAARCITGTVIPVDAGLHLAA